MRRIIVVSLGMLLAHPVCAQTGDVRFGNLHSHTSYSDGLGTPADAYEMACSAGLDFFAITEHNHDKGDGKGERHDGVMIATSPELYQGTALSLVSEADAANQPGNCVTIYGQEFSTISKGNHVNVFDVDEIIEVENGAFDKLLDWMEAHPDGGGKQAVLQFNHPRSGKKAANDYGHDDFDSGSELAWLSAMTPNVSLIEVFNAPALNDGEGQRTHDRSSLYRGYLNLGFHLAPSVGQDNHFRNWGKSTDARVAAITSDFTRRGIIEALRARHVYASEDKNLRVIFRSGSSLQGDIVDPPAPDTELPLTLQVIDDDEPAAVYRVDVYKDIAGGKPATSPVETYELVGNQPSPVALEGIRFEAPGEYVFLRITQFGDESADDAEHPIDDRVWTAPIWFEPGNLHDDDEDMRTIRMVALLPDPPGQDLSGERITFKNTGNGPILMTGWQVRDLAGNTWELDELDQVAAGAEQSLTRNGQPMSLNNGGDRIELVAPDGTVVQIVDYDSVAEGEVVTVSD